MEITLSMATMVSDENHFVTLVRGLHGDTGTVLAQEMMRLRTRLNKNSVVNETLVKACTRTIETFGNGNLHDGLPALIEIVEGMLFLTEHPIAQKLLQGSLEGMQKWGITHPEYMLLALNILHEENL
ncbi:MAG: hypothetical protein CUN57_02030, partial [Phototrophicales bacterium]